MSNDPDELPTIDPAVLDEVTGGLDDSDGKILAALQGIQDTIKGLGEKKNNNSWEQMLPFLLMAFSGSGHFSFGSGGNSGQFSFGSGGCGCGCGGRGSCRRR
jgi:hypothetical protein